MVRSDDWAEPSFAAFWIDARVSTDRDARTVTILDMQVPKVRFPNATPEQESELVKVVDVSVKVTKDANDTHAYDGDTVSFTITAKTLGSDSLKSVTLDDAIKGTTHACDTLTGPGRIMLQTMPFSRLADRILAAAPRAGGRQVQEGAALGLAGGIIGGLLGSDNG